MIEKIFLARDVFVEMGVGLPELVLAPPLSMHGLSKFVVLAGPNGGGKSRLLRLLPKLATKKLNPGQLETLDQRDESLTISLVVMEEALKKALSEEFPEQNPEVEFLRSQIEDHERELRALAQQRLASEALTTASGEAPRFVSFVPQGYKLQDHTQWTLETSDSRATRFTSSIENSQGAAPAYAARILRLATEGGFKRMKAGLSNPCDEELESDRLLEILRALLGADVQVTIQNNRIRIGEFDPYWEALSAGQQMLFQFGCLLHAQAGQVENAIVLMDEPENHLHPAALIQVIEALVKLLSAGQLWIATHSVPLIAHLMRKDEDCLWFVNEGRVKRSGRTPELVLESLLGGEQGAADLQALTRLPSTYASNRFLSECLLPPNVVGPDVKDPQTLQIRKALWGKRASGENPHAGLRILDFGAGKGRLLATLNDTLGADGEVWFDYIAFDPSTDDEADCKKQIEAVYGSAQDRWFGDLSVLKARLNAGSFDAIVMCNVLHEVTPDDWPSIAKRCDELLRPTGNLVIVEDYGIPIGERAHDYGFLLLNEQELVALFSVTEADRASGQFRRVASEAAPYRDRLVAHLVGRSCMSRVTPGTRAAAIETLHGRMSDEVKTWLRNPSSQSKAGRNYARSAQLMTNAAIWLDVHRGSSIRS